MKKNEMRILKAEELNNVNGGVVPGPNGESCTEHGTGYLKKTRRSLIF